MTTITENTTIKKAPAKKTADEPTKITYHNEYKPTTEESVKNTKLIEQLTYMEVDVLKNTKLIEEYKTRLDSMHSKNESLQNKLDLINMDNVQLAVPQGLITKAVNDSIAKVHNKYIETIKEGQSLLDELELDEINDILSSIKNNKYDIDVSADDINDLDYAIENAVSNELDYKDYCTSSDVDEIIGDAINPEDYITTDEYNQEYKELERRLDDLTSIIENKQKQVNIFKRLYNKIKVLFSYSFKSKVRVK